MENTKIYNINGNFFVQWQKKEDVFAVLQLALWLFNVYYWFRTIETIRVHTQFQVLEIQLNSIGLSDFVVNFKLSTSTYLAR